MMLIRNGGTFMKFEEVTIKNFRNFENVRVNIANKNLFFGLNDIGKTNFLYALRFIFDKDIRKNGFIDSDFHQKQINTDIELTVKIDISDSDNSDTKKLRAKMKGAILSDYDKVYIHLKAKYIAQDQLAYPELFWGVDLNNLTQMVQTGYRYDLDYVFNVIYIDSYVNLQNLFKRNISTLIKSETSEDEDILNQIKETVNQLNSSISSLSGIKDFEDKITPEFNKFRNENILISLKSEFAMNGLYSSLIPYIQQGIDENLYPTSGEGRKKLLTYSIYNLLAEDNDARLINLFLVEEPENHLHKSLQIALSHILFTEEKYKYLFLTTHSPFILYDMDDVNLIRVYKTTTIDSASCFYNVPEDFETNRKMLNRYIAEAIFANKVLLVEGPSELMLFDRILSYISPYYEANGNYILAVNGVGFSRYCKILSSLKIDWIVKTDNDLHSKKNTTSSDNDIANANNESSNNNNKLYYTEGFNRCNKLIGEDKLPLLHYKNNNKTSRKDAYKKWRIV